MLIEEQSARETRRKPGETWKKMFEKKNTET